MSDTSQPSVSKPDAEVADPEDVDSTDVTAENDVPVDNPAG